jgi:hypothetical protein
LESNDTQVRLLRRIGTALHVQPKNKWLRNTIIILTILLFLTSFY